MVRLREAGSRDRTVSVKVNSLATPRLTLEGFELSIGKIVTPREEARLEPLGPTPKPSIADLRDWDMFLLNRYKPFYLPFCDMCCFCTYGKCDLTGNKKGACGLDLCTQQGRMSLFLTLVGTSTHLSHAKDLVEFLIKKCGKDTPIDLGEKTPIEAPIIRTVTGIIPKRLGDLEEVIEYAESQIPDLLASLHTGQEGSYLDFESKALHAGMIDMVAMETADLAQICALGFPKAEVEPPLVEMGLGAIDKSKPVILCVGHNVAPGSEIIDYLKKNGLHEKVEVCGICCTALDMTRYSDKAKIVGPISEQIRFVRSGVADVIVVDEQCVRADILEEAMKVKTPVISTSNRIFCGFPNRTSTSADEIIKELLVDSPGVAILDPEKAAEVAVRTALRIAPERAKLSVLPNEKMLVELAKKCTKCGFCVRNCPKNLPIDDATISAADGNVDILVKIYNSCLGCARCEQVCPGEIPIVSLIQTAKEMKFKEDRYKIRCGRGAIQDYEIRMVADRWALGTIPGMVALVGCANYPGEARELYEMAYELLERNFIVTTSGCSAMTIGMYKDENGLTLYEKFPGNFDHRCLVNVGSCVANAHIVGAAIRVASTFARRILRGNFMEIADYILNRVGACGIAWGAMSQKALSIATGCNRFGVPVIIGPQGTKYRRLYLGRREETDKFLLREQKTDEMKYLGPVPEHLLYVAESKGEALVMASKLCMRPSDIPEGRQVKVMNYIEMFMEYYGKLPDDLDQWIRFERDIPITIKGEIMKLLKEKGWKPLKRVTDITTLPKEKIWTFEALRRGYRWFTA